MYPKDKGSTSSLSNSREERFSTASECAAASRPLHIEAESCQSIGISRARWCCFFFNLIVAGELKKLLKMDMEIQPVPWWNRRSRMERNLIWLIGSLLIVSIGLAIGLGGVIYKPDLFITQKEALVLSPLQHDLDPR